jgi:hypothetical protein
VADSPLTVKRIGGTGPVVDDLEWDIKVYFAINAAVHEAACAAWSLKRYYDGWRPITAIRYMGGLGQASDPASPSYHPYGLPLITNLIELVTSATAAPGGRHEGLPVGAVAILAWPGQPSNPANHSGVKWILPDLWLPYQKANFVTPSFPGYSSGHSTFSRAAAEVMAAVTGTNFFPGGLASYTVTNLSFEAGPTQPVQLQWATYFDAADQAGLSRIWGGIHPPVDDFNGRRAGSHCGLGVWALARTYFDGSVTNTPILLTTKAVDPSRCEFRYTTLRGFYYKLQSTTNLNQPFSDEDPAFSQAVDSSSARTNTLTGEAKLYRVVSALAP